LDKNKILEVVAVYRQKFEKMEVEKTPFPHNKLLPLLSINLAIAHCYQMLDQMELFIKEGRTEKTFRWLGFIQGVLWVLGIFSLEDLKNHNRPTK